MAFRENTPQNALGRAVWQVSQGVGRGGHSWLQSGGEDKSVHHTAGQDL